jgi:hypothetical protein
MLNEGNQKQFVSENFCDSILRWFWFWFRFRFLWQKVTVPPYCSGSGSATLVSDLT